MPVEYFVEEVSSVCSRYWCVYVVVKRWEMGVVGRLNEVLEKSVA